MGRELTSERPKFTPLQVPLLLLPIGSNKFPNLIEANMRLRTGLWEHSVRLSRELKRVRTVVRCAVVKPRFLYRDDESRSQFPTGSVRSTSQHFRHAR